MKWVINSMNLHMNHRRNWQNETAIDNCQKNINRRKPPAKSGTYERKV